MQKTVFLIIATIFGIPYNFSVLSKPILDQYTDEKCNSLGGNDEYDNKIIQNPQYFQSKSRPMQYDFSLKASPKSLDFPNPKRSLFEDSITNNFENTDDLQRRQVGVVYKEDKPIGILQPYQRTYRFIPVKDEPNIMDESISGLDKRSLPEINLASDQYLEENYPSIYTNFKIDSQMEKKKRDFDFNDGDIRQLKKTIRRLRSAKTQHSELIEDELKGILDDMGLIEEDKQKRQVDKDFGETPIKSSDANCPNGNNLLAMEQKNQVKTDFNRSPPIDKVEAPNARRKRQKFDAVSGDLMENLRDSGELRLTGNKSPLAFKSETPRAFTGESNEENVAAKDENRLAREIQKRLSALRERVQRELREVSEKNEEDEDSQRKKRQTSLMEEETDALNPALHPEAELKSYVRKKRSLEYEEEEEEPEEEEFEARVRRNNHENEKQKKHTQENEEAGELLNELDDAGLKKRSILLGDEDADEYDSDDGVRGKRDEEYVYEEEEDERPKRSVEELENRGEYLYEKGSDDALKDRKRRMIDEDKAVGNRPRQLGDMSDLDLFGALPKSYNGELSRYKRV